MPSLSLGTRSFILAIYWRITYNGGRHRQTVIWKSKKNLVHFSKGLKVGLLYSIRTVIRHLKLYLNLVPSSSRMSLARGVDVFVEDLYMFRVERKPLTLWGCFLWYYIKETKELLPSLCLNTFPNFNTNLNERQMSADQTKEDSINGREMSSSQRNRTNRWSKVQTDARCPDNKREL